MLSKTFILAILGFTTAALALPADTSAAVPQMAAEDCWRLERHDREARRECRDFNDQCQDHHDRHDWRGPEICHGHYWNKRATTMTAEACWELPRHDREGRRECREFNEQCRHDPNLLEFVLPALCNGHSFYKREDSVAAEDCWRLNDHDRRERHECEAYNRDCKFSHEPRWKLPESCDGHYYN